MAKRSSSNIYKSLWLKRVEACEADKTAKDRRVRKEKAEITVKDISNSTRALQTKHIHQIAKKTTESSDNQNASPFPYEECTCQSNFGCFWIYIF